MAFVISSSIQLYRRQYLHRFLQLRLRCLPQYHLLYHQVSVCMNACKLVQFVSTLSQIV